MVSEVQGPEGLQLGEQTQVKDKITSDKRNLIDQNKQGMVKRDNLKWLYDITKKIAGQPKQSMRAVKDKLAKELSGPDHQLNKWAEHFEKLLNQ